MGKLQKPTLRSRVLGAWQGKSVGGTLGLPAEGKMERQYYRFYDPIPDHAPPNDDLELQLVWLDLMERHNGPLTINSIANAWLAHIHYMWDEYGRCRWNLRRGVPPSLAGAYENPFDSGMGSPIRSEIWAIAAAGNPDLAERFATLDSTIDHGAEGIAGEVFFAVLQSLILGGESLAVSVETALQRVSPETETRRALDLLSSLHRQGIECWTVREKLLNAHRHDNFTHAPLNVALTLWALLYGNGDFESSILLAVNGGYDTDCTAATAGAILGMLHGAEQLPKKWLAPLGNAVAVGPGILAISAPKTLEELTERSLALIDRAKTLTPQLPVKPADFPAQTQLRGNVTISAGSTSILWANGELPDEIKANGGCALQWHVGENVGRPFRLIALARDGCQLWIDGKKIIDCPAGLPYIPATHRSPTGSFVDFLPTQDRYEIRIELNSRSPIQPATLLLADAALHLVPWNGEQLPHTAKAPVLL
ncbi:MAG: ADP-ribosylglycohydrolase family protein [Verrucomicrobiales bacterium]|jgi:ADP-ribosylglycohydrolase|nr:ADP-ribosylglycohydrolase family protein [Verrucomicrobiales bacterium]